MNLKVAVAVCALLGLGCFFSGKGVQAASLTVGVNLISGYFPSSSFLFDTHVDCDLEFMQSNGDLLNLAAVPNIQPGRFIFSDSSCPTYQYGVFTYTEYESLSYTADFNDNFPQQTLESSYPISQIRFIAHYDSQELYSCDMSATVYLTASFDVGSRPYNTQLTPFYGTNTLTFEITSPSAIPSPKGVTNTLVEEEIVTDAVQGVRLQLQCGRKGTHLQDLTSASNADVKTALKALMRKCKLGCASFFSKKDWEVIDEDEIVLKTPNTLMGLKMADCLSNAIAENANVRAQGCAVVAAEKVIHCTDSPQNPTTVTTQILNKRNNNEPIDLSATPYMDVLRLLQEILVASVEKCSLHQCEMYVWRDTAETPLLVLNEDTNQIQFNTTSHFAALHMKRCAGQKFRKNEHILTVL